MKSCTASAALGLVALVGVTSCGSGAAQRQSPDAVDAKVSPTADGGRAPNDDTTGGEPDRGPADGAGDTGADAGPGDAGAGRGDTNRADALPDVAPGDLRQDDGAAPGTGPVGPPVVGPWPSTTTVVAIDRADQLGMNLSGLAYLTRGDGNPAALLAVQNSPPKLHRLTAQGSTWAPDSGNGWTKGKTLRYPNGKGEPDAEGVTLAGSSSIAYVASESDGGETSRLSILRFDLAGAGTSLTATHEWNLTTDLPKVDANLGLEAITWIPDEHLTRLGFRDDSTGAPYQPDRYPNHGGGVFLVGLEASGTIYAYALDHQTSTAHRLASFTTGQKTVVDLSYDSDFGVLWAACDDNCDNRITLLAIDASPTTTTQGRFVVRHGLDRPPSLPNGNNEGITFAPLSECQPDGQRRFFWADDSAQDGHALRMGEIPCRAVF